MKKLALTFVFLFCSAIAIGCNSSPIVVSTECIPPAGAGPLDIETCVDSQDQGICRWNEPTGLGTDHVTGCVALVGDSAGNLDKVTCVDSCPVNHYDK